MRRILCRLSVALLAMALGITITHVSRTHPFLDRASTPSSESLSPAPVPATANDQSNHVQVANDETDPL